MLLLLLVGIISGLTTATCCAYCIYEDSYKEEGSVEECEALIPSKQFLMNYVDVV
jgi:hypothetical protein